jgi:hypothetical protein
LISGIFQTIPSLLVLTLFVRKHFFLAFLIFQVLRDSKKGKVREHGLEILRRTKWDEVGHQEVNSLQMRPDGMVSQATSTRLRSVPRLSISPASSTVHAYAPRHRPWRSRSYCGGMSAHWFYFGFSPVWPSATFLLYPTLPLRLRGDVGVYVRFGDRLGRDRFVSCLLLQVGPLYAYIYSPERLNNTSNALRQFSPLSIVPQWFDLVYHYPMRIQSNTVIPLLFFTQESYYLSRLS